MDWFASLSPEQQERFNNLTEDDIVSIKARYLINAVFEEIEKEDQKVRIFFNGLKDALSTYREIKGLNSQVDDNLLKVILEGKYNSLGDRKLAEFILRPIIAGGQLIGY